LDERLLAQKREPNPRQLMQLQQQQGGAAATAGGSRAICSVNQASLEVWVRECGGAVGEGMLSPSDQMNKRRDGVEGYALYGRTQV